MRTLISAIFKTLLILMLISGMATWFLQTQKYKPTWLRWSLRLMPFVIFVVIYLWQVL